MIYPVLLILILLLVNTLAIALPPQPNSTEATQKAKELVEAFRNFIPNNQASIQQIEDVLAIDLFVKRSISNYWERADFEPFKEQVLTKFRTILREGIYGQMQDIFKEKAVQVNGRYLEAYRQINESNTNPVVVMSSLQQDTDSNTGLSVMNLEFTFERIDGDLKIIDIAYYWHLDCPRSGAAVYQWRKGNRYYETQCDGCVENTQSVWLEELPEATSTYITRYFKNQITEAINDGGGGESGYNNLIRSMDARIEQIKRENE